MQRTQNSFGRTPLCTLHFATVTDRAMDHLHPQLRAVLDIPIDTEALLQSNVGALCAAFSALHRIVEASDGVNVGLLATPPFFELPESRDAFLRVVCRVASWSNLSELAFFYASVTTFWLSLIPGGPTSIAEAGVLARLCSAASHHMGGLTDWLVGSTRICSTIKQVVPALAADQNFGAPAADLATFVCRFTATFYYRPPSFTCALDEAHAAIMALRVSQTAAPSSQGQRRTPSVHTASQARARLYSLRSCAMR